MRFRERRNTRLYSPSTVSGTEYLITGGSNTLTETMSFVPTVGKYESISDVVVPRYQERSGKGEVFINPMVKSSYERELEISSRSYHVTQPSGTYSQSWPKSFFVWNTFSGGVGHLDVSADLLRLRTLAGTEAAAGIDAPEFQGAVFLGELRETIGFLRNPLNSWAKFLKGLQSPARSARASSTGAFLRDNWLSYRYAVRPLVYDARSAIKAINKVVSDHTPIRSTSRGFSSTEGSKTASGSSTYVDWTSKTDTKISCRAGVLYEYSRSPDTFGLSAQQLPVAAWELIPYSFVVDWFANIGPFIEAITPKAGVKVLGSWTTVTTESRSERQAWWARGGTSGGYPRVIGGNNMTRDSFFSSITSRTPGIEVGLTSTVAPLSGDIGKARILDLVALSTQLLNSRP